jgi:hypothetical protein
MSEMNPPDSNLDYLPMPPPARARPHTVGSSSFDPDAFFEQWDEAVVPHDNDLKKCILRSFKLKQDDDYEYHAIATVTLNQVQSAINAGGRNGMHAWYRDENGFQVGQGCDAQQCICAAVAPLTMNRFHHLQQQI